MTKAIKDFKDDFEDTLWSKGSKGSYYPSCFETHKPLDIAGRLVYGGSASRPVIKDADIYVALDLSGRISSYDYPWNPPSDTIHIHFPIRDMNPPDDPEEFKKMIEWLVLQLLADKKIHVGCIGGHGRTGMLLAALYTVATGEEDSISEVRSRYCHKAVESSAQVAFLHQHFGIKKVPGAKSYPVKSTSSVNSYAGPSSLKTAYTGSKKSVATLPLAARPILPRGDLSAFPASSLTSVWGNSVVFDKSPESVTIT